MMPARQARNVSGETRFGGPSSKDAGGMITIRCRKKSTSAVICLESTDSAGVTTATYLWPQPDGSNKLRVHTSPPANYITDGVVLGTQT
jgi:hypothetical protein